MFKLFSIIIILVMPLVFSSCSFLKNNTFSTSSISKNNNGDDNKTNKTEIRFKKETKDISGVQDYFDYFSNNEVYETENIEKWKQRYKEFQDNKDWMSTKINLKDFELEKDNSWRSSKFEDIVVINESKAFEYNKFKEYHNQTVSSNQNILIHLIKGEFLVHLQSKWINTLLDFEKSNSKQNELNNLIKIFFEFTNLNNFLLVKSDNVNYPFISFEAFNFENTTNKMYEFLIEKINIRNFVPLENDELFQIASANTNTEDDKNKITQIYKKYLPNIDFKKLVLPIPKEKELKGDDSN